MLDRSIPFCNLILRCDYFDQPYAAIPDGYRITHYHEGLEASWARLETEIGDFQSDLYPYPAMELESDFSVFIIRL